MQAEAAPASGPPRYPDPAAPDLLTTERGATLVSGSDDGGLALIDGDSAGPGWRTDYPHRMLPVSLVFELAAPARLVAVGVDNAAGNPSGVEGGAARSIRFEGAVDGPGGSYSALAELEAEPDARTVVPVPRPRPVRWVRLTIDTDHGGGRWVHLDEAIAYGDPVGPDHGGADGAGTD